MIDANKRKAIFVLHNEGMGIRELSRKLNVSINTVRNIIDQEGELPEINRPDKIDIDPVLVGKLYKECGGYARRVYEILEEDMGIDIGYSTLTRNLRQLGLGHAKNQRCDKKQDTPGGEMQHDTSPYTVRLGDARVKVQASLIYMRYSKVKYLKFYRSFNRFAMKCFIHEALTFWGMLPANASLTTPILPDFGEPAKMLSSCLKWSSSPSNTGSNLSVMKLAMPIEKQVMKEAFIP